MDKISKMPHNRFSDQKKFITQNYKNTTTSAILLFCDLKNG